MAIGVLLIVTLVIILAIWFFIEVKRARHKVFAIILILIIVFVYFSITHVFVGKPVDYKTMDGLSDASKIYFTWLGGVYGNIKTLSANAINLDWDSNNSTFKN